MAEQTKEMAVENATPKKTAFISKPYSQEERNKKDEEELKELLDKQAKGNWKKLLQMRKQRMRKNRRVLKRKLLKTLRRFTKTFSRKRERLSKAD